MTEYASLKIFCKLSLVKNLKKTKINKARGDWSYTSLFTDKELCLTMDYVDGSDEEIAEYFAIDPDQIIAIKRVKPKTRWSQIHVHIKESYDDELEDLEVPFTYGDGELDVFLDKLKGKTNEEIIEEKGIDLEYVTQVEDAGTLVED
ncbi:hypothetical protein [Prochlorococcus sp. MIT 1223]|uniref:hypothetical protein n=1 Tax=Prochlorococcus sp. MIT 1223 TaxID=3096217 RepID=UPI002A7606FA|nr:hypothetical protein [Prochlorococcus sp. MIT 1223]